MIAEQVRLPLVGLAAHEPVEVIEAHPRGPLVEGAGRAVLKAGRVVVLAEPRRGIAILFEDLADRGVLRTDDGIVARVARGQLGDHAEAHRVMVAAGDQRCPRGRAQRRGVELRVAQSRVGDAIQRRRRDDAAEGARNAVALVVGHDEEHVGRAFGRHDPRRPPRLGILGAFLDHAAELRRRRRELFPADGRGGAGRTGCAGDLLGWRWQGDEHRRGRCQQRQAVMD